MKHGADNKSGWTGAGVTLLVVLLLYVGGYYVVLILPQNWRLPNRSVPAELPMPDGLVEVAGGFVLPDYHGPPRLVLLSCSSGGPKAASQSVERCRSAVK